MQPTPIYTAPETEHGSSGEFGVNIEIGESVEQLEQYDIALPPGLTCPGCPKSPTAPELNEILIKGLDEERYWDENYKVGKDPSRVVAFNC